MRKTIIIILSIIVFVLQSVHCYNVGYEKGYAETKKVVRYITPSIFEVAKNQPTPLIKNEMVEKSTPIKTEHKMVSMGMFTEYAYDACYDCCGKLPSNPRYGITATGTKATEGRTIAVDPTVIPLGSKVIINGHEYIAEDTGSGIVGKTIDVYFNSHTEASQHGRKQVEVFKVVNE